MKLSDAEYVFSAVESFVFGRFSSVTFAMPYLFVRIVFITGPLGFSISNLPNNAAEMMGVTAFRVEPY